VPVGLVSWLVGRAVLPTGLRPQRRARLDLPGNILVLTGLAGLVVSLSLGQTSGASQPLSSSSRKSLPQSPHRG